MSGADDAIITWKPVFPFNTIYPLLFKIRILRKPKKKQLLKVSVFEDTGNLFLFILSINKTAKNHVFHMFLQVFARQ